MFTKFIKDDKEEKELTDIFKKLTENFIEINVKCMQLEWKFENTFNNSEIEAQLVNDQAKDFWS